VAERIRFHLDEHMDPDIALALRRHGIDVTTTVDAGLRTADDPHQLNYVRDAGRVMVTDDADFLRVAAGRASTPASSSAAGPGTRLARSSDF
jgi:predicted nuclease of predicted toxin-antitoxin system